MKDFRIDVSWKTTVCVFVLASYFSYQIWCLRLLVWFWGFWGFQSQKLCQKLFTHTHMQQHTSRRVWICPRTYAHLTHAHKPPYNSAQMVIHHILTWSNQCIRTFTYRPAQTHTYVCMDVCNIHIYHIYAHIHPLFIRGFNFIFKEST